MKIIEIKTDEGKTIERSEIDSKIAPCSICYLEKHTNFLCEMLCKYGQCSFSTYWKEKEVKQ